MNYVILVIVLLLVMILADFMIRSKKTKDSNTDKPEALQNLTISGAYQSRFLFSENERDTYRKLKELADANGYNLFAKVRLLDLVEPVKGNPQYRTYMNKIQSKHVDFVLCDQKLIARCIIELDDNSHARKDRQERDSFVDEVLTSTGYTIIHCKWITDETTQEIITVMS